MKSSSLILKTMVDKLKLDAILVVVFVIPVSKPDVLQEFGCFYLGEANDPIFQSSPILPEIVKYLELKKHRFYLY